MKKFFVFKHNITGGIAKWGISQSPYDLPDNLQVVIEKFNEAIEPYFKPDEEFKTAHMTYQEIMDLILKEGEKIPEFMAWGEPKIASDDPLVGTSSRFHRTKPDYDWISLEALARNVANDILWDTDGAKVGIPTILKEKGDKGSN